MFDKVCCYSSTIVSLHKVYLHFSVLIDCEYFLSFVLYPFEDMDFSFYNERIDVFIYLSKEVFFKRRTPRQGHNIHKLIDRSKRKTIRGFPVKFYQFKAP